MWPSFYSFAMLKKKKTVIKSNVGRKGFIWLKLPAHNTSLREVWEGSTNEEILFAGLLTNFLI